MILDANAVSALADGDPAFLAATRGVVRFSLPVIVLGEYRFGIARSRHREKYREWLEALLRVSELLVVDHETASHYATVRSRLREQGRPIPSNDAWIAALAIQHRLPVLTRDEHFGQVGEVTRLTW